MPDNRAPLFAHDPLGSIRLASNYAERALLGTLSPGFGAIFLALGYASLQAEGPYRGIWVIGVLAVLLAAAHVLLPRRDRGDIWLTPLSLTILFIAAGQTFAVADVPLAALLTVAFAAAYGWLILVRRVASADALIFLAVGPIFMTAPELMQKAQAQGWLWYQLATMAVIVFAGGAIVWRRGFFSALIVVSAFFYYSIWVPFSLNLGVGPESEQAVAAVAATEAAKSPYTFLLSMGAKPALIGAVWLPMLMVLLARHWAARRATVGAAKAFLDQNVVSAAMGVVVLYGAFALAPQVPIRYLFDLNAALFCAWLIFLITQNRTRWAPYAVLIWLVVLQRVASHLSLIEMGLAIALYAATTIAIGGGLIAARVGGGLPADATRKCVALLIVINVVGTMMFVGAELDRQVTAGLKRPEFEIYAALYLLIVAAVFIGLAAALLASQPPAPRSIWRGQLISARAIVVLRRFFSGFWGRNVNLAKFPFISQGAALARHLRGDDRNDLVSLLVYAALLYYLAWATLFGPIAPFISVVDPTPGQTFGARVVQFGLLTYLFGRVTRFRLYAYFGVFAILWSGVAALDLGSWGSLANRSPAESAGFAEIAGAGASTALFLHKLAAFLGPNVIVPGVGLIACEVIRSLVDPVREWLAARLTPRNGLAAAAAGASPRPRWLMPSAAGVSVFVALMVGLSVWGGSGAAFVDAMAKRTARVDTSPAGVVLGLARMAPRSAIKGGQVTMQRIQFANWASQAPPMENPGLPSVVLGEDQPMAILVARIDLGDGGQRVVHYSIYRQGAGARIVLELEPPQLTRDEIVGRASLRRRFARERQSSEVLYLALKAQVEALMAGAANPPSDLSGISVTELRRRPFVHVEGAANETRAVETALVTAGAALQQSGISGPAVIEQLPEGRFRAGYIYQDFEVVELPESSEARLGYTPEGQALRFALSGAGAFPAGASAISAATDPGAAAVRQRLVELAGAAGLQPGQFMEIRSESSADANGAREYYLLASGRTAALGCVISAIDNGFGYCSLDDE